jgi:2'-5' RNA ligase
MHAIVSILDDPHSTLVMNLWRELETACGLTGVKITPIPHFSWQLARDYDFPSLALILKGLAETAKPFTAHTTGLALFTGINPVVHIPIVRDPLLTQFHRTVWQAVSGLSSTLNPLYSPDFWMPHITLAHSDVDRKALECAVGQLAPDPLTWEIEINNIALVYQRDSTVGELQYKLDFGGGNASR